MTSIDNSAHRNEPIEADVIVIGGGGAGLAAAVALARSRRSVVVIDAGQPRNAPAAGIHNALGLEGIGPRELLARGRAEAEGYGVRILDGTATAASGAIDDFTVEVDGGMHRVHARRVILATGLVDELPELPGIREAWGRSVLHCPFCHGWEVRDQRIVVLAGAEIAMHQLLQFRQLSENVTLLLHEAQEPTPEQQEELDALDVTAVRGRVERLRVDGTQVRAVVLSSGKEIEIDAVVVAPRFHSRTELHEGLGGTAETAPAETTPVGRHIPVDLRGATDVAGLYAAGNAGDPMGQVMGSIASGVTAGAAVHGDLAASDLRKAVQASRVSTP